jgi:hypothetical protein
MDGKQSLSKSEVTPVFTGVRANDDTHGPILLSASGDSHADHERATGDSDSNKSRSGHIYEEEDSDQRYDYGRLLLASILEDLGGLHATKHISLIRDLHLKI